MHPPGDAPGGKQRGLAQGVAEVVWYPTALLAAQGEIWAAVDERTARATMRDAGLAQTLTFVFGSDDLVQSIGAEARGRTVGGRVIPAAWEGRWPNYAERSGMLVPAQGEAAWLPPEVHKPNWRGPLTGVQYEFASY